jgi:hypothetical protein
MAKVNRYRLAVYGSSAELPGLKAKIELYYQTQLALSNVGKIRFHEGSLPIDSQTKRGVVMNLPASLLSSTLQVLRNETPLYFTYHEGRAVLGTTVEPIGSHDEDRPRLVRIVQDSPENELEAPPVPAAAELPATSIEEPALDGDTEVDTGEDSSEGPG